METKADWAWLPEFLLDSIIKNLVFPADHLRFGAVCKHWLSVAKEQNLYMVCCKNVPALMIPTQDCSTERRSLYKVTQGKNYSVELPIPYNRRCCGPSHGWLAFAMDDLVITLYSPFLGKKIYLPRLLNLEPDYEADYYVRKVVLSTDPLTNPNDLEVVAIYSGMNKLAFIKAGQETWTHIPVDKVVKEIFCASDVIYFKGSMYVVNYHNKIKRGRIVSIDTATRRITTVALWKANGSNDEETMFEAGAYLVESSRGELLIVDRLLSCQYVVTISEEEPSTSKFKVYKIAVYGQKLLSELTEEVKNIGDDAMFLGDNQSMSVSASDLPGCHPNSIYYSDDYCGFFYPYGPHDMAIFNLEDGSFRSHYVPNPLHKKMPPPLWIATKSNH